MSVLGLLGSVAAVSAVAACAVLENGRLECSLPDLLSVAQLRDPRLLKSGNILKSRVIGELRFTCTKQLELLVNLSRKRIPEKLRWLEKNTKCAFLEA